MKQFLKYFFACFLAIAFVMFLFFMVVIGSISASVSRNKPDIKSKSVLVLNTNMEVVVQNRSSWMTEIQSQGEIQYPLMKLLYTIEKATTDPNIDAILIRATDNSIPYAFQDQINVKLKEFQKKGKKIYAYGAVIDQGSYMMANIADKFVMNPEGMLMVKGFNAELTFYKGLMDKLGIKPEIIYVGKFKSATEPYRLSKMSEENRKQMSSIVNDYYSLLIEDISKARSIDTSIVNLCIDQVKILNPDSALKYHFIDKIGYESDLWSEIGKDLKWNQSNTKEEQLVQIDDYLQYKEDYNSNRIAVLNLNGEINYSNGDKDDENITAAEYLDLIDQIKNDKSISAVVAHVNSPGGDAVTSDMIWHALKELKEKKPVVVFMSNYAASGGYYISTASNLIFADPYTLTGSIGVFMMAFDGKNLFNEKLGITFDNVKKGNYADYGSFYRPMTESEKKLTQENVNRTYMTFKQRVSEGRHISIDSVEALAQGHVYTGREAVRNGLVDSIGSIFQAIAAAGRLGKLNTYQVVEYPEVKSSPMSEFINSAFKSTSYNTNSLSTLEILQKQLQYLENANGKIQMKMPFEILIN